MVTYLAREVGIWQFLDIGTALPTANNTHEVAQAVAPTSRIVYVDNDPAGTRARPGTAARYLLRDLMGGWRPRTARALVVVAAAAPARSEPEVTHAGVGEEDKGH